MIYRLNSILLTMQKVKSLPTAPVAHLDLKLDNNWNLAKWILPQELDNTPSTWNYNQY